jgi:hypothetical protein
MGIRGVVLRSLNRQRLTIAWDVYREMSDTKIPSPTEVADLERIFQRPGLLREIRTNTVAGVCTIGSSLNAVLRGSMIPIALLDQMEDERYVVWFDRSCLSSRPNGSEELRAGKVHLHICLKEGYTTVDQFKAWAHAVELGRMLLLAKRAGFPRPAPAELVLAAHRRVEPIFAAFLEGLRTAGWNTADAALLSGSPRALVLSIEPAELEMVETDSEEKKDR